MYFNFPEHSCSSIHVLIFCMCKKKKMQPENAKNLDCFQ